MIRFSVVRFSIMRLAIRSRPVSSSRRLLPRENSSNDDAPLCLPSNVQGRTAQFFIAGMHRSPAHARRHTHASY
jgi:hypothetical protein